MKTYHSLIIPKFYFSTLLIIIICLGLISCKKEEERYAEDFIGIYSTQIEGHSSTFTTQVSMKTSNSISIRTNWAGKDTSYTAFISKYKVTIPAQYFDRIQGKIYNIAGTGELYNKNTLVIDYHIGNLSQKHIGSK